MINQKSKINHSNSELINKFHQFLETNTASGVLLIVCSVIALLWANSSFFESYEHLWHTEIGIEIGSFSLRMHLLHWINDGLMAIFFFVVGLEIKREIIAGELSSIKKASLPALGALGGMLLPALIFIGLNFNKSGEQGWGIPMATDIAFSLGILSLLGKRVPIALKVFLVALAIVDDLGAILVIALFYTSELQIQYLIQAFALITILLIMNWRKVRAPEPYLIIGIIIWYFFYLSGIHATIAGVLIAFTIPISRTKSIKSYNDELSNYKLDQDGATKYTVSDHDIHILDQLNKQRSHLISPLQRMEHGLHNSINFFIMPIFALANAGVHLSGGNFSTYEHISLNVALALIFGKTFGISLFAWLGIKLKISEMPSTVRWNQMISVAILGGLGFTMSLFISNLAYLDNSMLNAAKIGVLGGSAIAGVTGYLLLNKFLPKEASII